MLDIDRNDNQMGCRLREVELDRPGVCVGDVWIPAAHPLGKLVPPECRRNREPFRRAVSDRIAARHPKWNWRFLLRSKGWHLRVNRRLSAARRSIWLRAPEGYQQTWHPAKPPGGRYFNSNAGAANRQAEFIPASAKFRYKLKRYGGAIVRFPFGMRL